MARMLPPTLPNDDLDAGEDGATAGARDAEVEVWPELERLPDGWAVLHNWRFINEEGTREVEREADFVVVTPDRGVVVFEVKGGKMRYLNNGWRQNNHDARPETQARNGANKIVRLLQDAGLGRVPSRWGMIFPHTPRFTVPGHLKREQVVFKQDYLDMGKAIADLVRTVPTVKDAPARVDIPVEKIVEVLAPSLEAREAEVIASADAALNTLSMEKVEATRGQIEALRTTRRSPRVCVEGPAGSGKTLIAAHLAREEARAGGRVLLMSPSGQIRDELLSTKLKKRGLPDGVFVHDPISLVEQTRYDLEKAGMLEPVDEAAGGKPGKRAAQDEIAIWLMAAAEVLPEDLKYSSVLVDEAQDIDHDVLEALEGLARDVDRRGVRVVLFADPWQRLADGEWWGAPDGYRGHMLTANLRNTADIARLAHNALGEPMIGTITTQGLPPLLVEVPEGGSAEQLAVAAVAKLVRTGLAPDEIAVLAAGRRSDDLTGALNKAGIAAHRTGRTKDKKPAVLCTGARDIKGRECSVAVCVFGTQSFDDLDNTGVETSSEAQGTVEEAQIVKAENQLRLVRSTAYVALSRARSHVVVIGTAEQLDVLDPDRKFRADAAAAFASASPSQSATTTRA